MKIKYTFADGTITEVEVEDTIGATVIEMNRLESNADRKERYHCCKSDDIEFEGKEYHSPDIVIEENERNNRIDEAFTHLTEKQQKYIFMLADGLSLREISRKESKMIIWMIRNFMSFCYQPTNKHIIICDGNRYNIYSVENVKNKGMYLEILGVSVDG